MAKYLFKRPDSQNWCIRFRYPDKVIEKSLCTPDIKRAEILSLPLIAQHKAALLSLKPRLEALWRHDYKPGLHANPDGGHIAATDTELQFYGADGQLLRTTANGRTTLAIVNLEHRLGIPSIDDRMIAFNGKEVRTAAMDKTEDDAILETYLKNAKHGPVSGYDEREARAVWFLFKQLTDGKPLAKCDRNDGRKLVAHFEEQELKSATIEKKIAWLNAACNLAIRDGVLKINPFAGIAPKRGDKLQRKPFNVADVKTIKGRLGRLDKNDQLLVRLLAATGIRISEAFEIKSEETERGCRFVMVGHKTPQSLRRVPFPTAVLPFLPKSIRGPLFKRDAADPADAASKRLNRFLRECGVADKAKVIHSFRHRAADQLRAAECPQDIRYALLGHEKKSVAENYGEGFSVPQLKRWIDKIGF